MASRINIGPENGPYVAINEENGNLQLEDNSGNVVAEWDETNAQWDFANNTLANVDALNSNSVNTADLDSTNQPTFPAPTEADQQASGLHSESHDSRIVDGEVMNETISLPDYVGAVSGMVQIRIRVRMDAGGKIGLRIMGDDGNNYDYDDTTGDDNWRLLELPNNGSGHGVWYFGDGRSRPHIHGTGSTRELRPTLSEGWYTESSLNDGADMTFISDAEVQDTVIEVFTRRVGR